MTCDFDNGKCCGACNSTPEENLCKVCETEMEECESTEFKTCDGCGEEGCQHTIRSYDDEDFEYERYYCSDCIAERIAKGKIR